jgi:pilus assembly protein CpaB
MVNDDMPLVRYRVGDRGAVAAADARCACGRSLPVLASVEGRADDVLVTRDGREGGGGRTSLALEDVEVLAAAPASEDEGGPRTSDSPAGPRVTASLRVTLRQAVYLTAAQSFAREIRLLPRAPGDRRRGAQGLRVDAGLDS